MTSLHERQYEFAAALLDPTASIPSGLVGPDGRPSVRRFGVYRNNVIVGLVDALRGTYPAVCRLVGEEFFLAMARMYATQHPPESPVLISYGASFAGFLERFEPVKDLPYLPDVARMEYAWVESYHAEESEPLAVSTLETIAPEDLPGLRFHFHPSTRLVSSKYPALTIWRMNLGDIEPAEIALADSEAEEVLIVRPRSHVEVRGLLHSHALWIQQLIRGETVLSATASVLECISDFDPAAALVLLMESNAVKGLQLDPTNHLGRQNDAR
ncbi:MAG: DNA-binding domain-containing protein [Edaphobacter sp.]|uniref:HvfC/BufC N-terminal domain-containing protein n=1 Tax=Edaphobacter sp. TaxID=1934404 RepID=UPI00238E357D|nr:DNA-binding domain-containing protein [Edaphobacter sp.]MDE1175602.1 DNA-binding domain-containing protein [Edaphobacter sp.]